MFKGMPEYVLRGVRVQFPYEAYDVQVTFFSPSLLHSLQSRALWSPR